MDNLNYLGAAIGAIAAFMLGAVWYSPLMFAKKWMELNGFTEEDLKKWSPTVPYTVTFFGLFILALVINVFVNLLNYSELSDIMYVSIMIWLAFTTVTVSDNTFGRKPWALTAMDVGYRFTCNLIIALCLFWIK